MVITGATLMTLPTPGSPKAQAGWMILASHNPRWRFERSLYRKRSLLPLHQIEPDVVNEGGSLAEDGLQSDQSAFPAPSKRSIEVRIGTSRERLDGRRKILDLGSSHWRGHESNFRRSPGECITSAISWH